MLKDDHNEELKTVQQNLILLEGFFLLPAICTEIVEKSWKQTRFSFLN